MNVSLSNWELATVIASVKSDIRSLRRARRIICPSPDNLEAIASDLERYQTLLEKLETVAKHREDKAYDLLLRRYSKDSEKRRKKK